MIERADLIVFDFDGTLCDSAGVKTEAFGLLYRDEGFEIAQAVLDYHAKHQGVSRYDKIRWAEEALLGRTVDSAAVDRRAALFSEIVFDKVIAAPMMPGAEEFLDARSAELPLAVASATPTEELRRIVEAKGLSQHFRFVGGSPTSKGHLVRAAMDLVGAVAKRTVMVGDQPSDVAAAAEAGCSFIGFAADDRAGILDDIPLVIDSFDLLPEALGQALLTSRRA